MIKLSVGGKNYELNDKIVEYTHKKIGSLEKYLPKQVREGIHGSVTLIMDQSGREHNECVCEVNINVPGAHLQAKEATHNMFAAVDIAEAKIKAQMLKYKDKHSPKHGRAKVFLAKILRKHAETE